MGITLTLTEPLYGGTGASSSLVPGTYPVAINGKAFLVDLLSGEFERTTVPLLRAQADTGQAPSESSLNPAGLWRRAQDTWHLGAGQTYRDREGSAPTRFRSSKGVDPWTEWRLSLLGNTTLLDAAAGVTNLALATAGAYLYEVVGNEVYWRTTLAGPTEGVAGIQAGEAAQSVKSICSDGQTVYAALGSNGIHSTVRGTTVSTHYNALSATLVDYVKGRLMAANGGSIYNVTASGAAPSALFTHANTGFAWVGFAEGTGHLYAAGYSGDKSLVYRSTVRTDGTALDAPVIAGELPDGEIVRSIGGYLGFVLLGTDKGLRFCQTDTNGNLILGALVPTGVVRCFEGQDRYVYFGWDNYDAVSTGLGRLDLSTVGAPELAPLAPAYASDLMATAQGAVTSVVTFLGRRVFAVSGVGFYAESLDKVPSGTIDSGLITYGLPDPKIFLFLDMRHEPLAGSVTPALAADNGAFASLAASATANAVTATITTNQARGRVGELRMTLARSATDATKGPAMTGWTLRSQPDPDRVDIFTVPLVLAENVVTYQGDEARDPESDYRSLRSLVGQVVTYQEMKDSYTVILEDLARRPTHERSQRDGWNGGAIVRMKTLS